MLLFVSDEFYGAADSVLKELGFENVQFIPQTLSEADYLLPEKCAKVMHF